MLLFQPLKLALRSLRVNKGRAFLTSLGILIGIASVVMVVSIGAGAQSLITTQISSLGSNLMSVLPGGQLEDGPPVAMMGVVTTTLTLEDAEALGDPANAPNVQSVCAYVKSSATASYQGEATDTFVNGVSYGYIDVESATVADGRFFTSMEQDSQERVAVLGATVAEDLFNGVDPLGKDIKINRESFRVIGVLESRGSVGFQDRDGQIFVPVTTAQKLLLGIDYINLIRVKVDSEDNLEKALYDIRATLRARHDIRNPDDDDFMAESVANIINMMNAITDVLRFFLTAIAAISLVIGGIGIMNIMLISVTERIREIGLRKAIGAPSHAILRQFLLEAVLVTLVGGLSGIFLGSLISVLVGLGVQYAGYRWEVIISLRAILIAFCVSCLVGVIFGYYPAKKAARLRPIEALRHE